MKGTHYLYQQQALDKIIDENLTSVAVSFPCGMGKSRLALAWLEHLFYKHARLGEDRSDLRLAIIVAPNGVHEQWVRGQIVEHYNAPCRSYIWKAKPKAKELCGTFMRGAMYGNELSIVSFNIETFSRGATRDYLVELLRFLKEGYWPQGGYNKVALILDEATFIKNPRAQRTLGVMQLSQLADYRMFLTASMYIRNVSPAYMCYEFLKPGVYRGKKCQLYYSRFWQRSYNEYMSLFGIMYNPTRQNLKAYAELPKGKAEELKDKYAAMLSRGIQPEKARVKLALAYRMNIVDIHYILDNKKYIPIKNLDLFRSHVDSLTFTADKKLLNLPPKMNVKVDTELSSEVLKLYNQLKRRMRLRYGDKVLTVQHAMILARRLQLLANGVYEYNNEDLDEPHKYKSEVLSSFDKLPKTGDVLEKVRQITESGERVIVWGHSPVYLDAIAAAWFRLASENENDHYVITGQTGSEQKGHMIDIITAADSDKPRVLFISPLVGAFGLNLQDYAHQIWALNSGFLERRYQGEERSHRVGQKSTVFIYDFVLRHTIEETMYELNIRGMSLNTKLNSNAALKIEDIFED